MGIQDANSAGFVHGGMVMKTCDEAAAIAAIRHCGLRVVTAGMDRMTFTEPVNVGELLCCRASVNAAWRTSMEVGVRVEAEDPRTGEASPHLDRLRDDGRARRRGAVRTRCRRRSPRATTSSAASARPSCAAPTGWPSATRSSASAARH